MQKRFKVSLKLSRKSVPTLISFATNVVDKSTGNSFLASPHPALADISTAIADLVTANSAAQGGGPVDTTTQRAMRTTLENLLTEFGHYVEDVANEPGNAVPEELPVEIIQSAGLEAKPVAIHQKQIFALFAGRLAETVTVTAATVARGFHEWQYTTSTPTDETEWIDVNSTTRAKTVISGLVSGTRVYVRHRVVLRTGPEDWTSAISVIVP